MVKKLRVLLAALSMMLFLATGAAADKPEVPPGNTCARIQDGTILASDGIVITTGIDRWGYNYQAQTFSGPYMYAARSECTGETWCDFVMGVDLRMKWNDAWMSNTDCDNDGILDRHYGLDSYVGSGAWFTNRISGQYEFEGSTCTWDRFLKIVAIPVGATTDGYYWYSADGSEIGQSVTLTGTAGPSAVLMTVMQSYSDRCGAFSEPGYVGVDYKSPVGPGLGNR